MGKVVDALVEGTPLGKLAWDAIGVDAWWEVSVGKYIREALIPIPDDDFGNEAMSQQQMLRSPTEARRSIYGQAMVSGPIVFAEETGTDNEFLHLVIPLAAHRCQEVLEIYFDDEVVYQNGSLDAAYNEHARINIHLGAQTAADSDLLAECEHWTASHVGLGITYLYVRLKHDPEFYANGLPNIKALVQGKPLYDPRKDSTVGGSGSHRWDDVSTWEWSDNWALCVLDYTRFESGVGALASEIDLPSYALAANDSDQLVEYDNEGNVEPRYTCNGTFTQSMTPASVLDKLLTAGAGMQTYSSGKYQLFSGVYQGPHLLTLGEADLAGEVEVRPFNARAQLCNAVRGTFVDPENFYQPTDFAPYESDYYRAQDNDEYIDHDIDLPFTQSAYTAQRLAKLYLELNRAGQQIVVPLNMIGLSVSVGQVVELDLPRLGIKAEYQVMDWSFDFGQPIKVTLRETAAALFDYGKGSYTDRKLTPVLNLPSSKRVPTVGGVVWTPLGDDANWQGLLTWNAPGGNSAYRYRLEVSDAQSAVVYQATIEGTQHHIPKLDAGNYTITLWAVNLFANRSNVPSTIAIGADAPPAVTGILVDAGALELTLRPQTAAITATTTEFEVKGGLSSDIANALFIGQGKEVIWPGRHANTQYFIWARATNNFGTSAWFGPIIAQTTSDKSALVDLLGTTFDKYTWFAWADDDAGTGFTTDETAGKGKLWMGVARDKAVSAPSGNWEDYTWTKVGAVIGDLFTASEQQQLDNLMAGKLPNDASKEMLALQDALADPKFNNNLLTAQQLLNQGIDAADLGGETPAGAQAKANAAEAAAALDSLNKANTAKADAEQFTRDAVAKFISSDPNQVAVEGNTVYCFAGNYDSWSRGAYSAEGFAGGCILTLKVREKPSLFGARWMMGINTDPLADNSYASIDYAFYILPSGDIQCFESGVSRGTIGLYAVGDILQIKYDGANVTYLKNGTVLRTVPTTSGRVFYMDSSFCGPDVNSGAEAIVFAPAEGAKVAIDAAKSEAITAAAADATTKADNAKATAIAASDPKGSAAIAGRYASYTKISNNLDLVNPPESFSTTSGTYGFLVSVSSLTHVAAIGVHVLVAGPVTIEWGTEDGGYVRKGIITVHLDQTGVQYIPVDITLDPAISAKWSVFRPPSSGGAYLGGVTTKPTINPELVNYGTLTYLAGGGLAGGTGPANYAIYFGELLVKGDGITDAVGNLHDDTKNSNNTAASVGADPAGSAAAAKLQAIGDVSAGNFAAQTALITTLLANSGLFNQLKSRLGSFGGLTAETIAALAIATNHLQAGAVTVDKVAANAITAEKIAALAIATNHLQAGAITSDKVTVDTALINKLVSSQGLFDALQARFAVFGGLAAQSIAAGAIHTDKLSVLAREFVNPVSVTGNLIGWGGVKEDGSGGSAAQTFNVGEKAIALTSSANIGTRCKTWRINHDKIYRVSIKLKASAAAGHYFFGAAAFTAPDSGTSGVPNWNCQGNANLTPYNISRNPGATSANSYFGSGVPSTNYVEYVVYLVGANRSVDECPANVGVLSYPFIQVAADATDVAIRVLNWSNTATKTVFIKDVSVTEVGGGQIVAENIAAGAVVAGKIAANAVSANEVLADTALINKLVGTSALFNDLVARLAVFGGLTANSIAAGAILGTHIKAGEKIQSPIIEGGQFRNIGPNTMRVESETPFGPDSLVEWRGPKLLVGGEPDWANLRKSNAKRWTDSNGDEYFGGSLSAGILRTRVTNPDKNFYVAGSYPVTIGPFSTNGSSKSVIVSFVLDASYRSSSSVSNPVQPSLSWQLERKIGSGNWAVVSSGTFSGTTTVSYDGELNKYETEEYCSGASTYTDNSTSTSDFSYRVKIISQTRYHAVSNVTSQLLSVESTEQ
nr:phage tail protein [Shewanella insulae]